MCMKRVFQFKRMMLLPLLPLSLLLVLLARRDNRWVEGVFARFVYRPLSFAGGSLSSLVPFSVTEALAPAAAGAALAAVVWWIVGIARHPREYKHRLYRGLINLLCVIAVALFLFEIEMGLNYYRAPAADHLGLDVRESSAEELYTLTAALAEDMNACRAQMTEDEQGVAVLADDWYAVSLAARDAYRQLSEQYPFLRAADIRNKPLRSSKVFSAVLTTGLYFPYTFESNINVDVPAYTVPATMCHELTHFRGFMRENEANFLGYLACMGSKRADFRYSGAMMAFSYCYPKLYRADKESALRIAQTLSEGVLRDIAYEDAYWEQYEHTAVSQASNRVYEGYLNANDQKSGLQSYGEMVDLLLAYQRKTSS